MPACCNRFRARVRPRRPARRRRPGRLHPQRGQRLPRPAEPVVANPGTVNSDGSPNKPNVGIGYSAGTGGGYGPVGVNGSHVFLPFGLDPARTPVMGSYNENTVAAKATSAWYQLPPRTAGPAAGHRRRRRRHLVLRRRGRVQLRAVAETAVGRAPAGRHVPGPRPGAAHRHRSPQRAWRNLRFPLAWAPPEANVARIVADDPNLSNDQWFAFTPPRVPVLQTAQQFLGSQTPVLMDIATAANFPCQRPFSEHLGVAELPDYRILPELQTDRGRRRTMWQSAEDGGPFLFIQALLRTSTIPTYLRDDWYRDWGSIERYDRVVPADAGARRRRRAGQRDGVRLEPRGPIRALP